MNRLDIEMMVRMFLERHNEAVECLKKELRERERDAKKEKEWEQLWEKIKRRS